MKKQSLWLKNLQPTCHYLLASYALMEQEEEQEMKKEEDEDKEENEEVEEKGEQSKEAEWR